jgi:hypothetical protein
MSITLHGAPSQRGLRTAIWMMLSSLRLFQGLRSSPARMPMVPVRAPCTPALSPF